VLAPGTLHSVALQRAGPVRSEVEARLALIADVVNDDHEFDHERVSRKHDPTSWSGLARQWAERRRLAPFRDGAGGGAPGNGLPPLYALGFYDHQIVFPSQPDAGSHRGADPRTFGARFASP